MNFLLDTIYLLLTIIYYYLEAFVCLFIPASYRCKDVRRQIVLITGAGSGIGRLMSLRFARLGCSMVLWDVNDSANQQTADDIRQLGCAAGVHTYTCDVTDKQQVYEIANKVKTEVGDVDILINNAGIVTGAKILDCPDKMIEKTFAVNTVSHFWTTKAFLPVMLERNRGHVVTIASTAGLFGVNGLVDYCSSKFAAVGFDETLRAELYAQRKTGVHTTVVCPVFIDTGMFDGSKTRFEMLLPILSQDYAVDKIVEAVLTNQLMLCIPRFVYFMITLKHLFPVKAMNAVNDYFGINNAQDAFRGRRQHAD